MFSPIEGGSSIDIQGLICNIPAEGYVFNLATRKVEYRGIHKRSSNPKEQYWERTPLPSWYKDMMKREDAYEKKRKEDDPPFYDEQLEIYKQQEWDRRLNGFWFMNNGKPTYITGAHYMYMQWFQIDVGYPRFRQPDLEYFYFLQYVIEDPECMGMLEVTKRRFGKTYRGGLFLYEYITRTRMTNAGIQSKTGNDAKKVFAKAVVAPFKKLPKFFRPEYDTSLGITPKSEIRFQQTNVRGKKAEDNIEKEELGSMIDWGSADTIHYDGQKIHRYFSDEWAKCFAKGTKIRMYDGSIKNIEEIGNGELVMGDDSKPRLTYGVTSGKERMYRIIPNSGEPFECNESHILSLKKSNVEHPINISVRDYISLPQYEKKNLMLWRVGVEYSEKKHKIEPYFLGAWLGDGNSSCSGFTSADAEIVEYMQSVAGDNNLLLRKKTKYDYHISSGKPGLNNCLLSELKNLDLIHNKHIPNEYLIDSRKNRLELLAGLIDTDGYHYVKNGMSARYEISQKNKTLAYQIQDLARSLGFKATLYKRVAKMVRKNGSIYSCDIYKVSIYGDIFEIPCKIDRKKAKKIQHNRQGKNPLRTGFSIMPIGEGEYYGFAVGDNHLFLLADYTVAHNTSEINIYDRHEVIRYCLLDDEGKIIGKALYSSTVEKLETERDGIQEAARKLWDDSDQNAKQPNGRTPSGLYRFFMSADRAKNFDLYGIPDVEKTIKEILADRESVKHNTRSLAKRIKKEARTIEEAFSNDADDCIFNVQNINAQIAYLRQYPVMRFRYLNFYRDLDTQKVRWRDVDPTKTDLYWKVLVLPPNGQDNQYKMNANMRMPTRGNIGVIGIDGYSNSQGGKEYGSKLSGWYFIKFDINDPENTGLFGGHIYGRPNEKEDMYNQILLCSEYMSFPTYFEFVSDDYYTYFKNRGRLGYLGRFPKNSIDPVKLKNDKVERHFGFPTTEFALTKQNDAMITYIEHYCNKIYYEELLDDLLKFKPYKRTPSDRSVSAMITLVSSLEPIPAEKKLSVPLIKIFNNAPTSNIHMPFVTK